MVKIFKTYCRYFKKNNPTKCTLRMLGMEVERSVDGTKLIAEENGHSFFT